MPTVAFGYKCQECGQGTVLETIFPEYKTKVKGYPLVVENARIGVCDRCGAEHFDPNETVRWRTLLQEKQSESYLRPDDIRHLRKELGLSMEQFAALIGCTRQSLYNWEKSDRSVPQSRMADLFMRLIRESRSLGQLDVLGYLTTEAEKLGLHLAVSPKAKPITPIVAFARKSSAKSIVPKTREPLALVADTEAAPEEVVLVTEHNQPIARLFYDYTGATLNLLFLHDVPFAKFDADIEFRDGSHAKSENASIKDQEAILISKTKHTEEDVAQVVMTPHELLSVTADK